MGGCTGLDLDRIGTSLERWHGWRFPDPDLFDRLLVMSAELRAIAKEETEKK